MAKAELGTKRLCPNCGAKYYDLGRKPIICPRCGTPFEVPASGRGRAAAVVAPIVPDEEIEQVVLAADVEVISLDEADEEAGAAAGDDEEAAEAGEDTFLEPDDEAGDDVTDIIGDVDEEEP